MTRINFTCVPSVEQELEALQCTISDVDNLASQPAFFAEAPSQPRVAAYHHQSEANSTNEYVSLILSFALFATILFRK